MRYHNITHDDMQNGDGLRVVLWLSGCNHHCDNCQNPLTWDAKDGLKFGVLAKQEIFEALSKDYISGITFSGGDPLHEANRWGVTKLIREIKQKFPDKTVWLYTGYTWREIRDSYTLSRTVRNVDVLVEGRYVENLKDVNYHWAGSKNQLVIDVQESIKKGAVVLHESYQEGRDVGAVRWSEDCKCCN